MPFVDDTTTNTYNPRTVGPTPPAAKPPTPAVTDSIYGDDTANANTAYNNAKANINYQRGATGVSYGLNQDGSVDPYSDTGQYQVQRQGQGLDLEQVMAQMRGRGFGDNEGAVGRQEGNLRFTQKADTSNLLNDFYNRQHGFDVDELTAGQTRDSSLSAARAALVARLTAKQAATPPPILPPGIAPKSSVATAAKKVVTHTKPNPYKTVDPWLVNLLKQRKR